MNQMLHIIRKDVRRMRWPLLLWILVLFARLAVWRLSVNGPADFGSAFVVSQLSGGLASLETFLAVFLAARLIHGESAVGWNAFWLTRPYSRNALIAEKLAFAVAVLLILPLAADLITIAMFHAGGRAQATAAVTLVGNYAAWTFPLLALAALTPSLAAFAIAVVAILAGFALLFLVTVSTALFTAMEPSSFMASVISDPAPQVIATLVTILAALAVIVYQYRNRRWRIATALAVAGCLVAAAAPAAWQSVAGRTVEMDPGAWTRDAAASPAIVDRRWYTDVEDSFRGGQAMHQLYGRIRLGGMPSDYVIQSVAVDATLRLPDGTTLASRQSDTFNPPLVETPDDGEWPGEGTALRAALGGVQIVKRVNEPNFEHWPSLIRLSGEDYSRHRGKTGRLTATLYVHLDRTRKRGTLPLAAGAALDDTLSRVEVLRAGYDPAGYRVSVRRWRVFPLLQPRVTNQYSFVLQNRSRREALTAENLTPLPLPGVGSGSFSGSGGALLFAAAGSSTLNPSRNGFAINAEQLRYPTRIVNPGEILAFGPDWFEGAELVVVERSYVGTVKRTLVIDDFTVPTE